MQELKEYVRGKVCGMETARMLYGYDENTLLYVCLARKSYIISELFPNMNVETFYTDLGEIVRRFYLCLNKSKITDQSGVLREMNVHEAYLKELCDDFLRVHARPL
jgi:hypothetical protein